MAVMFPGVRPSMRFASAPTAATIFWDPLVRMATTEGSSSTMPRSRTSISVLAVPRSMDRSLENMPRILLNMLFIYPEGTNVRLREQETGIYLANGHQPAINSGNMARTQAFESTHPEVSQL